jgi:glutamate 5-kinase
LSNYSANDLGKIKGLKTGEVEKTLGYKDSDEVIHRDNLVVL